MSTQEWILVGVVFLVILAIPQARRIGDGLGDGLERLFSRKSPAKKDEDPPL